MERADLALLEHWLLENPWPLAVCLAVLGVGLLVHAGRSRQRGAWIGAAAGLAGAAAVAATAAWITTPREQALRQTRELVALTAPYQAGPFAARFHPGAILTGPRGEVWLEGPELFAELQNAVRRWRVADHRVASLQAEALRPGEVRVEMGLRTVVGEDAYPVITRWRLRWREDEAGVWRVREVQWLELQHRPPNRGIWER